MLDSFTDGLHDPRALVAQKHRERMAVAGPDDVKVGVADTARLDPDPRFARARLVEVELLDAELLELA
jgi:hypothetical protein